MPLRCGGLRQPGMLCENTSTSNGTHPQWGLWINSETRIVFLHGAAFDPAGTPADFVDDALHCVHARSSVAKSQSQGEGLTDHVVGTVIDYLLVVLRSFVEC